MGRMATASRRIGRGSVLAAILAVVVGGVLWFKPIRVRRYPIPGLDLCTVEGPDPRYPMGFCFGHGIVVEWRRGGWH
jgi:hypothetical protein